MCDEELTAIPREILNLIPVFGGDKRQLNFFLRKSEYVIDRYRGHEAQNLYVYHSITSRLKDEAAALLSEREDICSWSDLKSLLIQHFGDPRTEQCINIELESMKIKPGESYLDFCSRIQTVRSLLISKVNVIDDVDLKRAKTIIYNNTSLNVFLYNLPENLIRIVRLKSPSTLEDALGVVLEEVNFHDQYNMRNKIYNTGNSSKPIFSVPQGQSFKFGIGPQHSGFKIPFVPQNNSSQKLNFTPQPYKMPTQSIPQNFGYRPQLGYRPPQLGNLQQFGYRPSQLGINPQLGYRPQFGLNPQPGYRPQFGTNQNQQQQPTGYKPNFPVAPPNFGYRPPQVLKPHFQSSDVTMRTALPRPREGFKLNELTDEDQQYYEYPCDTEHDNGYIEEYPVDDSYIYDDNATYETSQTDLAQDENFPTQASNTDQKK